MFRIPNGLAQRETAVDASATAHVNMPQESLNAKEGLATARTRLSAERKSEHEQGEEQHPAGDLWDQGPSRIWKRDSPDGAANNKNRSRYHQTDHPAPPLPKEGKCNWVKSALFAGHVCR